MQRCECGCVCVYQGEDVYCVLGVVIGVGECAYCSQKQNLRNR